MLILDFPKEIQSEIFTFAHRDNSNDEALLLPVEIILSHVCSQWRNIAINLPILWTAFKFDSLRRASAPVDKLQEYLVRSKTQSLELYFDIFATDIQTANQRFKLVEIAIAQAWSRCRRFALFVDSVYVPTGVVDSLKRLDAPHLEYFAMCLASIDDIDDQDIDDQGDVSPSVLIEGAPNLSVVRIDTTSHFHSLPPLSNVTTLTIQDSEKQLYLYSFRAFRSILMVPTLTNLSIESSMSLDTESFHGPLSFHGPHALPRIVMPSLRTLRIARDSGILGILWLLDAPLLETLVLHDLYLMSLYIGQGLHNITPFKKLDTFAVLDCRCNFTGNAYFESFDTIDFILHELAHCATHVIISRPTTPSLIENGSNLLNFEKRKWPRLQCITLDLSTSSCLMPYVKNFERSPHSLTVRVVEPVLEHWKETQLDSLTRLEKVCELETMKAGDLMMNEYWPAPGGIFHEDGNLGVVRWGESIRARGLLEE
jgi:hypothetical protein